MVLVAGSTINAVQSLQLEHDGLAQCSKCLEIFRLHTSEVVSYDNQTHYATNVGAVIGQMATDGSAAHLAKQPSVPSLTNATFVNWNIPLVHTSSH